MDHHFHIDNNKFSALLPSCYVRLSTLEKRNNSSSLTIDHTTIGDNIRIAGISNNDIDSEITQYFSDINSLPTYHKYQWEYFNNHSSPIISCIILLTFNDLFVYKQLIPSIISNSEGYPIEIIIAYNGNSCVINESHNIRVINTRFLSVASSYNAAAKEAKGKYIALFHDDCILDDPDWIAKFTHDLDNGNMAVTAEFHNITAKFVPLVMKKSTLIELGYLNEHYFLGIEDLDLTYNIYSHGFGITNNINAFHFRGMSTILLFTVKSDLFRTLFSYNALPLTVIRSIQHICMRNAYNNGLKELTDNYMRNFMQKYGEFIKNTDPSCYENFISQLENKPKPHGNHDMAEFLCRKQLKIDNTSIINRLNRNSMSRL